ncbi:MAG: hypothetical protein CL868_19760 [Cytophagaceae bacterium]|nr:hypothetical protein [Cytophagaceae bacterium]
MALDFLRGLAILSLLVNNQSDLQTADKLMSLINSIVNNLIQGEGGRIFEIYFIIIITYIYPFT